MNKKFLGSTVTLTLGILAIMAGLSNPSEILMTGIYITLCSLAYRSAKKRNLGLITSTSKRKTTEIIALIVMIGLILLQNNLKIALINEPTSNLVIPIWGIVAYSIIFFKKAKTLSKHGFTMAGNTLTPEQEAKMDKIAQALTDNLNRNTIESSEKSDRYEKIYAIERTKWPDNMGSKLRSEIPKELHPKLDRCIEESQNTAREACQTVELTNAYLKKHSK